MYDQPIITAAGDPSVMQASVPMTSVVGYEQPLVTSALPGTSVIDQPVYTSALPGASYVEQPYVEDVLPQVSVVDQPVVATTTVPVAPVAPAVAPLPPPPPMPSLYDEDYRRGRSILDDWRPDLGKGGLPLGAGGLGYGGVGINIH